MEKDPQRRDLVRGEAGTAAAQPHQAHQRKDLSLEEVGEEEEGGDEIVIDLFDELKIENYNDKMATDTFLPSAVADQALILPFFSAEAMAISEVATF